MKRGLVLNTRSGILVAFSSLLLAACVQDPGRDSRHEGGFRPPVDLPAPDVLGLVVEFGRFDSATGRAGAFRLDATTRYADKVFLEFNAVVNGPDGPKRLPTFEYRVDKDAVVRAPASGYVIHFEHQPETDDYEIGIARSLEDGRHGMVMVDHVRDIAVAKGDSVAAGQVIGKAGTWGGELGRVELMVVEGDSAYCPLARMPDSLKEIHRASIRDLMADWETFKEDPAVYDEDAMPEPGCNDLAAGPDP
ncbi:MAG TPA: M23 family metallopeptidase [Fibrobacteria bacterium]|jgi:hypothetical protein|nr:M23 family metallopeptidase [Fibrobacteria bacterium]